MSQVDRLARNLSIEERIDAGKFFGVSPISSVLAATNSYVSIATSSTAVTHAYISFVATAQAVISVYVGATVTGPGTLVTPTGFHLGFPYAGSLVCRQDVLVSSPGTKVADFLLPGGATGNPVGGAAVVGSKVVLPKNTTIYLELDNQSATTSSVEVSFLFYEVPS